MYDFIDRNKRLIQILLAVILLPPFAFFGVDYYLRSSGKSYMVAEVGSSKVTQAEFMNRLREQQNAMRARLGPNYDSSLFDNPEVRVSLLNNLVDQRLLEQQAQESRLSASSGQLQEIIAGIPAFLEDGHFSPERYEQVLRAQGTSPLTFEARLRKDLSLQPLQDPLSQGLFLSTPQLKQWLYLNEQQREVSVAAVEAGAFLPEVKISEEEAQKHYQAHQESYKVPEQVQLEYVLLSQDGVMNTVKLDPAKIKKYYEEHLAQYQSTEERRASHILITVSSKANAEEKAAAQKKAQEILTQIKKNPQQFPVLAKQYSQDPGSGNKGGDLGFFARGVMVKPFEEAAFNAKAGDLLGPIETDFGFHIIKVDEIKAAKVRALEEVQTSIELELKKQEANQRFASLADTFHNLVYEQAESLKPAADALGVPLLQTGWLTKPAVQGLARGSAKVAQMVFEPAFMQGKRNSEVIEIAQNTLLAVRVVGVKPAAIRPFLEVKDAITRELQYKQAGQLAVKEGETKLAALKNGKMVELNWQPARNINRRFQDPYFTSLAVQQIFRTPVSQLPAFVGVASERGGYLLYKIARDLPLVEADPTKLKGAENQLQNLVLQEAARAYLATLRAKYRVIIHQELLNKPDTAPQ